MDQYFFQPVDLPPLPNEFVEEALHGARDQLLVTSRDRTITDKNNIYRNATLQRWKLSQAIEEWLRALGVDGFMDVSVQSISKGDTLGPHTDGIQRCKLFYNLLPGGDCVQTIWYQEKDQPRIRPKFLLVDDTAALTEIHRCVIPARQWGFINVGVIHEVRGLTGTRETVVASFSDYIDISPFIHRQKISSEEPIAIFDHAAQLPRRSCGQDKDLNVRCVSGVGLCGSHAFQSVGCI